MSDVDFIKLGNAETLDTLKISQVIRFEIGFVDGPKIFFYEDGKIVIEGDPFIAMDHIIKTCWDLFYATIDPLMKTILVFDYFFIDIEKLIVEYRKPNPPQEFFHLKEVIEKTVFRKIKMKAFL